MTFVNHGIAGGLIHYLIWNNPIFIGVGVALGIAPDILGLWWHSSCHRGKINKYMRWLPAWGYHTWLDSFTTPYYEKKTLKVVLEIGHWVIYAIIGIIIL